MHRGLIITVTIAVLAAGATEAAALDVMSITYDSGPPSVDVVEYNAVEERNTDDNGDERIASEWTSVQHRIWGQSFRHDAADFWLHSVTLKLNNGGEGTANVQGKAFNVKVFSLDDMYDATANSILVDVIGNMPASMPTDEGLLYVTFDFAVADHVFMTAGQTYGFTVDFAAEGPTNITWFREHNVNYPNGMQLLSRDGGASWDIVEDVMAFWVVEGEIPEPATLSLLALGGGLAIIRRRKN